MIRDFNDAWLWFARIMLGLLLGFGSLLLVWAIHGVAVRIEREQLETEALRRQLESGK